jgi:hypothetical protein
MSVGIPVILIVLSVSLGFSWIIQRTAAETMSDLAESAAGMTSPLKSAFEMRRSAIGLQKEREKNGGWSVEPPSPEFETGWHQIPEANHPGMVGSAGALGLLDNSQPVDASDMEIAVDFKVV